MIIGFVFAALRHYYAKLFGYKVLASPLVQYDRLGHCIKCPYYDEGTCNKCGCLVISKSMLNTEQCPIKTWRRVWVKRVTTKKR